MAKFEKLTVESIDAGSRGIDEKRRKIITTLSTLLGFIHHNVEIDLVRARLVEIARASSQTVDAREPRIAVRIMHDCAFSATWDAGHHAGLKRPGKIGIRILDGFGRPFYDSEWSIDARDKVFDAHRVREAYPKLQRVIDALVEVFPDLPKWAMHIQDEANERMSAYPQTGWTREDLYRMPPGYRGE